MKHFAALVMALMMVLAVPMAMAGDVSGFEDHAAIDLTPFKDDFYTVDFDDFSYMASIRMPDITVCQSIYAGEKTMKPYIRMSAVNGKQQYGAWLVFDPIGNAPYFAVRIGENRYRIAFEQGTADIRVKSEVFDILREIASTDLAVTVFLPGNSKYELSSEDKEKVGRFVADLERSGLAAQLDTGANVTVITNYNNP